MSCLHFFKNLNWEIYERFFLLFHLSCVVYSHKFSGNVNNQKINLFSLHFMLKTATTTQWQHLIRQFLTTCVKSTRERVMKRNFVSRSFELALYAWSTCSKKQSDYNFYLARGEWRKMWKNYTNSLIIPMEKKELWHRDWNYHIHIHIQSIIIQRKRVSKVKLRRYLQYPSLSLKVEYYNFSTFVLSSSSQ